MAETAVEKRSGMRRAFRITTIVLGVGVGIGTFAWVSLVVGWFYGGERDIHRVHDMAWGGVGGLMIALPMVLQGWRPERRLAAMQEIALASAALLVAGLMSAEVTPLSLIAIAVVAILVVLHPARGSLLGEGRGVSWPMAILVLAAAVPLILYALDQADIARACPPGDIDPHCGEQHWTLMAALAVGILFVGGLASLRTAGWRIPAWTAGAAAAVLGAASLLFSSRPSALPTGWAVVSLVGGLIFIGTAEWEHRRNP